MISVVIPAYNEEKTIGTLLESLVKQKTKQIFEVIVVDNNCTDKTDAVASSYKDKLDLKIIFEKQKGRSPARRAGFAAAKGEIVFSTDADAVVPDNWIDGIIAYFDDPHTIAVTGTCRIYDLNRLDNTLFNLLQSRFMQAYRVIWGHYWLTGSNFAIRREVYVTSGGFDDSLNAMEDIHLSPRINDIGTIRFNRKIPVVVSGRRFEDNLAKGFLEYGWSFLGYMVRGKQRAHLSDDR